MNTLTPVKLDYKTLNKINKTKELLLTTYEYTKEDTLRNKLYKQFKELADEIVSTLERTNTGQKECILFSLLLRNTKFNSQQKCNLEVYIDRKLNNLKS